MEHGFRVMAGLRQIVPILDVKTVFPIDSAERSSQFLIGCGWGWGKP
jgi:hypothetical protein